MNITQPRANCQSPVSDHTEFLWDIRRTAKAICACEKTVYNLIQNENFPHLKVGRSLRFQPDAVKAWIAEKSAAQTSVPHECDEEASEHE